MTLTLVWSLIVSASVAAAAASWLPFGPSAVAILQDMAGFLAAFGLVLALGLAIGALWRSLGTFGRLVLLLLFFSSGSGSDSSSDSDLNWNP